MRRKMMNPLMKMIKVGDIVETIDDAVIGKVIEIDGNRITIITKDDFTFHYEKQSLIKYNTDDDNRLLNFSSADFESVKKEKESTKPKKQSSVKPKDRHKAKFVVDLHIHQLTASIKGMTKHDMLNLQIDTAKRQLEFAIHKRIPKVVFIHGVGEGILRLELQYMFGRYSNIEYYDADYKTYGLGATEVRIFQNG